ncbi:MAG: sodium:solute symporter [Saprospiraceae bacterium]|nr:sodium:solute symporter [Saprospiraceae bacterium]
MSPVVVLIVIASYFLVLYLISLRTRGRADNATFFTANRQSPWYVVAFGMIGASLSGVTFISIPGVVGAGGANEAFSYMQMVFGYVVGYAFISIVLLPIYYRLNVTTIYEFLNERLGWTSYKMGAAYFLISRSIGAAFRLYLVALVLDIFIFAPLGVPFWATVGATIILIWIYTFQGGIKTIVWTDTLQTTFMILAVILTLVSISQFLTGTTLGFIDLIAQSDYDRIFFFEGGWEDPNNFFKQFIAGALITVVMTGLDQDMMQKNLTCRNIREAQLNMTTFSLILVVVNLIFLSLGAMLYIFANAKGLAIPERTDQLYPMIALEQLSPFISIVFVIGLIAAAYSTADSALTSLTTSFCVDFLGLHTLRSQEAGNEKRTRWMVHLGFSIVLFLIIVVFHWVNSDAVINGLFKAAGYTYGPILGLFTFALIFGYKQMDGRGVAITCILAPILTFWLDANDLFCGFELGFLNLLLNGILSFAGLLLSLKWSRS